MARYEVSNEVNTLLGFGYDLMYLVEKFELDLSRGSSLSIQAEGRKKQYELIKFLTVERMKANNRKIWFPL